VIVDFNYLTISRDNFLRLWMELYLLYRHPIVVLQCVNWYWVSQIIQQNFTLLGANCTLQSWVTIKPNWSNFEIPNL